MWADLWARRLAVSSVRGAMRPYGRSLLASERVGRLDAKCQDVHQRSPALGSMSAPPGKSCLL
jgi:hypothetical protein